MMIGGNARRPTTAGLPPRAAGVNRPDISRWQHPSVLLKQVWSAGVKFVGTVPWITEPAAVIVTGEQMTLCGEPAKPPIRLSDGYSLPFAVNAITCAIEFANVTVFARRQRNGVLDQLGCVRIGRERVFNGGLRKIVVPIIQENDDRSSADERADVSRSSGCQAGPEAVICARHVDGVEVVEESSRFKVRRGNQCRSKAGHVLVDELDDSIPARVGRPVSPHRDGAVQLR